MLVLHVYARMSRLVQNNFPKEKIQLKNILEKGLNMLKILSCNLVSSCRYTHFVINDFRKHFPFVNG